MSNSQPTTPPSLPSTASLPRFGAPPPMAFDQSYGGGAGGDEAQQLQQLMGMMATLQLSSNGTTQPGSNPQHELARLREEARLLGELSCAASSVLVAAAEHGRLPPLTLEQALAVVAQGQAAAAQAAAALQAAEAALAQPVPVSPDAPHPPAAC